MKNFLACLLALILALSCNNKKNIPDVSGIKVDLNIQRFDKDFFAIDTTGIEKGLAALQVKYPTFLPLFLQTIIGVSDNAGAKEFYSRYKQISDSAQMIYDDFSPVKKQIEQAFRYVKYYFPRYKEPSAIITAVGAMNSRQDMAQMGNGDYTPDFMGPDFIGIGLQFYLGKDFSLYQHDYFINNVAPLYVSRRFSKEYIVADVMKLVTEDIFPDKSKGKPLIEQMIERGKQWWMLDKFLPETPDSVKTGYTKQQLAWCEENEGLMWSYIIKNEDLHSVNAATLQTYIGEAPFTSVFSQELSPGNIGQWIGWQIIKKYADKKPALKPEEVMQTEAKKILEEAKYKPK
ncbi:MAG: hypothetical protein JNN00_07600 [Chitinophagaceae bacterium]|nr:hypothetical protein [Chitinophagaceae bacterium]